MICCLEVGPPVVFCDRDVGNLQAAEALLPVFRVEGCGISKVLVKGANSFGKDLEGFQFIWAKGAKKLGGICKGKSRTDARHDGGHNLGCATYELALVYSETEVSVRVVEIPLFEVFFDGFEVVEKGIRCFVRFLLRKVGFDEAIGDGERRWQLCEVLLEQRGEKRGVSSGDVGIECLRIV